MGTHVADQQTLTAWLRMACPAKGAANSCAMSKLVNEFQYLMRLSSGTLLRRRFIAGRLPLKQKYRILFQNG